MNLYLRKKAVEICKAGTNVILDWGFRTRDDRKAISDYLTIQGTDYEWHYIDVSDATWKRNTEERNSRIRAGMNGPDFMWTKDFSIN